MIRPLLIAAALTLPLAAQAGELSVQIGDAMRSLSASIHVTHSYGKGSPRLKGSGVVVSKARSLAPFSKLRIDGPIDVRLQPGSAESALVQADDNIEALIRTEVEGDTLVVGLQPGASFSTRHDIRVRVDFKQLQALQIRGSGDVHLDRVQGERFELDINGSGDVHIGLLQVRDLRARLSGSGDLQVAGSAERQDFELSGSGDVAAAALSGKQVRARISGSGDLSLGVADEIDAELSGSGDLAYRGRPKVKSSISGSGEIGAH